MDKCHRCGKAAYSNPVEGFSVQPCDKCERDVCENCADTDADCVGDPPRFVQTSWTCKSGCRRPYNSELVTRNPDVECGCSSALYCDENGCHCECHCERLPLDKMFDRLLDESEV